MLIVEEEGDESESVAGSDRSSVIASASPLDRAGGGSEPSVAASPAPASGVGSAGPSGLPTTTVSGADGFTLPSPSDETAGLAADLMSLPAAEPPEPFDSVPGIRPRFLRSFFEKHGFRLDQRWGGLVRFL